MNRLLKQAETRETRGGCTLTSKQRGGEERLASSVRKSWVLGAIGEKVYCVKKVACCGGTERRVGRAIERLLGGAAEIRAINRLLKGAYEPVIESHLLKCLESVSFVVSMAL